MTCRDLRVYVVDPEVAFREALASNLRDDGHTVGESANGLELSERSLIVGNLVTITEYELPQVTGLQLADRLHAVRRDLPVIVVTACDLRIVEAMTGKRPYVWILPKSASYDEIHSLVHRTAAKSRH
ncbi:MAG: hypothetical protein KatS3mg076_0379 [Candidatus Binatia bacterium]|nr:MAG: hypothetical protein KatS3mg076_0379 [Candidatus Binatia bacterium]